jgi:hypothetical protein
MSRTLKCGFTFCGVTFPGTLTLPDEYFDGEGKPINFLLNKRLSAHPNITWDATKPAKKSLPHRET